MGSSDHLQELTPAHDEVGARPAVPGSRLTPSLSVVVAILYMMMVDGDISDRESSQLQAVIGADEATLQRAVAYAETHSVDQFLKDAPALLNAEVRLCLLMNVCDSLMADGELSDLEVDLFLRFLPAFGHSMASFKQYYDVIAIKDRTSILGNFDDVSSDGKLTPPLALVVSLLYMMSADGVMAEEEIGRLGAAVGASPTLLKAGLRYVGKVRAPQFLELAVSMLDDNQRMCILLNVCDAMMADGDIDSAEESLFRRMLAAFSVESAGFEPYLNIIFLKNDIPKNDVRSLAAERAEGVMFERKRTWKEDVGTAGEARSPERLRGPESEWREEEKSELGSRISQSIKDNIDNLSDQLDDDVSLDTMEKNARGDDASFDRGRAGAGEGHADLRAYRDAAAMGERRTISGKAAREPSRNLQDKYQTIDDLPDAEKDGLLQWRKIAVRMDNVKQRTRTIRQYLQPMLTAQSFAAVSQLPSIPALPPRPKLVSSPAIRRSDELGHGANNTFNNSQTMLLAFDEGGPIMSQSLPAANEEEANLNYWLRKLSVVLLPALCLIYGATMLGEAISGNEFITNENLAIDARIEHQMTNVQQTVYRVTPDSAMRASDNAHAKVMSELGGKESAAESTTEVAATTDPAGMSEREKIDRSFEAQKLEQEIRFQRHQTASALAATRQQWFGYAKAVVLLGLGMAFWGVLFRSMRMLQGSSAVGIAGLLMSLNAYWLFIRF
jgi:uncharacterized tellurite resistance protein B-like protein